MFWWNVTISIIDFFVCMVVHRSEVAETRKPNFGEYLESQV
jgi:hypothetical protein